MFLLNRLLKDILRMDLGETNCFKISDTKFLYVENWCNNDGNCFTTLELNDGEEINNKYELGEILEVVTLDYGNKKEIKEGLKFILKCYRVKYK